MSLLTNFQTVQDSINSAKALTDAILTHKYALLENGLRYSFENYELFSTRQITTNLPQSDIASAYTFFFTIEPYAWSNYRGIFGFHGGYNEGFVGIQYQDGTITWCNLGSNAIQLGQYIGTTNKKYDLVVRFGNGKINVWVNKTKVIADVSQNNIRPYGNVVIGRAFDSGDRYFYGKLGNIYIYNRALSDEEISQMQEYIAYNNK